jgi:hypothetical protein
MKPPGGWLRAWAARWCCHETMTRLIDPMIADVQHEHRRAVESGRKCARARIRVAFAYAFLKVAAMCAWRDVMSPTGWTSDERTAIVRTLLWSGVFVGVLTAGFEVPPLGVLPKVVPHWSALRYVFLAPQALATALTIGVAFGLVAGVGGRRISKRLAAAIVTVSVVVSIATFVNLAWVTPSANQSFRVLMSGSAYVAPNIPEMTLGELSRKIDALSADPGLARFGYLRALALNYHTRWAIGASPAIYAVFILSLCSSVRKRWLAAIVTLASFFAYYVILFEMRPWNSGASPLTAAWSANVCLLLTTALMIGVSARRRVGRPSPAVS